MYIQIHKIEFLPVFYALKHQIRYDHSFVQIVQKT